MANVLFSLFGWTFIPDFATKQLLSTLHRTSLLKPPQTPHQARKQYTLTFAFVVLGYLLYTLVQSARSMPPNFYQILGVPYDVDENGLKVAFRAFAKRFHPDRPGVGKEGAGVFMMVRDAYEALKDPQVRAAYDRFGPEALAWRSTCTTTRDFLHRGLMAASGYHIVAGIALLFWSAIGQPSPVSFWRYVLFAALLAGELSFILSPFPPPPRPTFELSSVVSAFFTSASGNATETAVPSSTTLLPTAFPSFLQTVFPQRVPFQHILFLHQLFMFLSVALSRVVPYFLLLVAPPKANEDRNKVDNEQRAIIERVFAALTTADREASLLVHTLLTSISPSSSSTPYHDPTLARMRPLTPSTLLSSTLDTITPEIENLVVEANIKNHATGPVRGVWEEALRGFKLRLPGLGRGDVSNGSASGRRAGEGNDENTPTPTPTPGANGKPTPGPLTPGQRTPLRSRNFWEKDVSGAELDFDVPTTVKVEDTSDSTVIVGSTSTSGSGSGGCCAHDNGHAGVSSMVVSTVKAEEAEGGKSDLS